MGTRTTIKIMQDGEIVISLYRHWDGYPAETGADLLETALQHNDAANLAKNLLAKCYEKEEHETEPRHVYKIEATAGDIEHYYIVAYNWKETIKFFHASRPSWDVDVMDWIHAAREYTPSQFAEIVNAERRQINQRLAQLREEQPTLYKDATDYPMTAAGIDENV